MIDSTPPTFDAFLQIEMDDTCSRLSRKGTNKDIKKFSFFSDHGSQNIEFQLVLGNWDKWLSKFACPGQFLGSSCSDLNW